MTNQKNKKNLQENIPQGAISVEQYNQRRPTIGTFDFSNFCPWKKKFEGEPYIGNIGSLEFFCEELQKYKSKQLVKFNSVDLVGSEYDALCDLTNT